MLIDTEQFSSAVSTSIIKSSVLFKESTGIALPFTADLIKALGPTIVKGLGVVQVLGSMLFLLRFSLGTLLLTLFILFSSVTLNNPYVYDDKIDFNNHAIMLFLNIGILGGLLFANSAETEDKNKVKTD